VGASTAILEFPQLVDHVPLGQSSNGGRQEFPVAMPFRAMTGTAKLEQLDAQLVVMIIRRLGCRWSERQGNGKHTHVQGSARKAAFHIIQGQWSLGNSSHVQLQLNIISREAFDRPVNCTKIQDY